MSHYAGAYDFQAYVALPPGDSVPFIASADASVPYDASVEQDDTELGLLLDPSGVDVGRLGFDEVSDDGDNHGDGGAVSKFADLSTIQGRDANGVPMDFVAEEVHDVQQEKLQRGKKRKHTSMLKVLMQTELFPIICPNQACYNDDKSKLESLKGTGGTRRGFLCICGTRWAQRMKRQDEATAVFGMDDPLIKPTTKRSDREIAEGLAPLPKVKQINFKPTLTPGIARYNFDGKLLSETFNKVYLTFAAGDHIFIDESKESNAEWSVGKLNDGGDLGYFPTSYVRKGTCRRNECCVKHAGHKGKCKIALAPKPASVDAANGHLLNLFSQ